MIKVGQIWQQQNSEVFVISASKDWLYSKIYKDGYAITEDYLEENTDFVFNKMLAEYPTWQEAVNSKEFNG